MKYVTPENVPSICVHPALHQPHIKPVGAPLYVVTCISNPKRFASRYNLYRAFEKMCLDAGARLYTIELALRDRQFEVTQADNPQHIQVRSPAELWHKENLLNLAIKRLPADWEYVAWIDADILFSRPDWVVETVHQLQHYKIIQLWSHALDIGPKFEPLMTFESFMYAHVNGTTPPKRVNSPSGTYYHAGAHLWHPGYAWAARRSALSDLGGLGDIGILGSGDHHMACALVGRVDESIHGGAHKNFKDYWRRWQARADKYIDGNVGYMEGTIVHYWHGSKKNRRYVDRWKVLVENDYNPVEDILYDPQGILQLAGNKPKLRDQIRQYFSQRNEDSVDCEGGV